MSLNWIQYQFIGFEWFWCSFCFCQPPFSLPLCHRIQFPGSTIPHPCWFATAAFRWKVWTSETNGNIDIHFIFLSTAINQPKPHDKLKDPQQHVFKSVLTTSHVGGRWLDGEKTDSNISAWGRYWLLPRYPQHMKFVTIYSLAGWIQQCNMPFHLPYPFLKRRLEKCRRIGVLGCSIDKIYPPMVRSEESIS